MSPRTPTYPGDSKAVRRVAATLEQLPVFLTNKKADVNDAAEAAAHSRRLTLRRAAPYKTGLPFI
jgi:hypothetical protein